MIQNVSVDTIQTDALLRVLDTVVIKLEGGTEEDLKILDEKPKEASYPERIFDKKNENDDDVIITSVEKKGDDEPKCVSPKPIRRKSGSDNEENWDEESPTKGKPSKEEKKKKSLKRKRTSSDSSSSSSSDSDSSSSSSSSEDEADDKVKSKYDLEDVKDDIKEDEEEKKEVQEDEVIDKEKPDNEDDNNEKKEEVNEPKQTLVENGSEEAEKSETEAQSNGKEEVGEDEKVKEDEKTDEKDSENKTEEKTTEEGTEETKEAINESEEKKPDDEQPETIDLDKVKDGPQSRALHRTSSIFLRNLAPSITKSEIEAVCQKFDGFLRVAIADPLVERRWYRRGWVTFKRDVNIKEICWNLNNTRLRDCEMGAIVNRDLSRRVRPVNGMTAHKTVIRADIKLCAKIAMNLDEKFKLWVSNQHK